MLRILLPIMVGVAFLASGVMLSGDIQGEVALGAIGLLVAATTDLSFRSERAESRRDKMRDLLRDIDELPAQWYPLIRKTLAARQRQ
jgi:hypothetical protein